MPGAYTPNCTQVHLPQYVSHASDFYDAGVDQIIVMVANDTCVIAAWADAAGCASAGIRVLSDRDCDVSKVRLLQLPTQLPVERPCLLALLIQVYYSALVAMRSLAECGACTRRSR
jgi:hypothetical protein